MLQQLSNSRRQYLKCYLQHVVGDIDTLVIDSAAHMYHSVNSVRLLQNFIHFSVASFPATALFILLCCATMASNCLLAAVNLASICGARPLFDLFLSSMALSCVTRACVEGQQNSCSILPVWMHMMRVSWVVCTIATGEEASGHLPCLQAVGNQSGRVAR